MPPARRGRPGVDPSVDPSELVEDRRYGIDPRHVQLRAMEQRVAHSRKKPLTQAHNHPLLLLRAKSVCTSSGSRL